MRIGVALTGVITVLLLTFGVVWFVRDRPIIARISDLKENVSEGLEIAKTGPYPKADVNQLEYDFGRIEVGEEGEFDFVIRNDGEAPLRVKKGPTTCQCTVSAVDKDLIEPGGTVKVTLKWKPTAPAEMFDKGAVIFTNDPENSKIQLKIVGMVVLRLLVLPEGNWQLPDLKESEPTKFIGKIGSTLDKEFEVTGFEYGNPLVTAEAVKLTEEEIADSRVMSSGFDIKVSVPPKMPVGSFAIPLKIKTSLRDKKTDEPVDVDVTLTGYRRGPVRVVGKEWIEDRAAIVMGSFDVAVGRKVTLSLMIKETPKEGIEFSEIKTDPPGLQVKLEKDEKFTGSMSRYLMTLDYPAGSARETRREENAGSIKIKTSHPEAPELEFTVFLTAY